MTDASGQPIPPPGCPAHQGRDARAIPLHTAEFAADPFAVYESLRRQGPVAPVELAPGVKAAMVTSYGTALRVMRDPVVFNKDPRKWRSLSEGRIPADSPVLPMMAFRPTCMFTDGDEHRRLRTVVDDSLARFDLGRLRGYVESIADHLIDSFEPTGRADLLAEYASPLPFLVMNEMFGCPPDLSGRLVTALTKMFNAASDADQANIEAAQCFGELIARKRAQPGEDLTSWMIAHPAELDDYALTHQIAILYGAGAEPGSNLIGNSLRLLLTDDRFSGSLSGGSLQVGDAVDEVLWKDPPMANFSVHYPSHDVLLEGVWLQAGEPVIISMAAANNDPSLPSDNRVGNRAHLSWGAGPHACPARSSARLVAEVAIERLLDRLPDVELAVPDHELVWRPGPFHRAMVSLPVIFPVPPDREPGTDALPESTAAPRADKPFGGLPPAAAAPPAGGGHATTPAASRPGRIWQAVRNWLTR